MSDAEVFTPALFTLPLTAPCKLWLDSCVLHQQTIFLQPTELRRNRATVSLIRCPMEPWHLLHWVLACPSAQQLISSSDDKNRSGWNADKLECTTSLRTFLPGPPSWNSIAETDAVSQPEWGRRTHGPFRSTLAKIFTGTLHQFQLFGDKRKEQSHGHQVTDPPWRKVPGCATDSVGPAQPPAHGCWTFLLLFTQWPLLRLMDVAQQIKPLTMLPSNVQSYNNLPMDCTAWQFWMTRQSIGCWIPALRSSAAKQWAERTAGSNDDGGAACARVL